MDFAHKLENVMKKQGVSSYRLAKEIGVKTSTITGWLNGRTPQLGKLKKAADFLNKDISFFTDDSVDEINKKTPPAEARGEVVEEIINLLRPLPQEEQKQWYNRLKAMIEAEHENAPE